MQSIDPKFGQERLVKILQDKGITDEHVLEAFRAVPRHLFVDGAMYNQAYEDNAVPIGSNQTISQPSVVALMTQLLKLGKDQKILEIGTGSGFQTAILAQFSRRLYTIERHRELGDRALKRLREMGYQNIVCKIGDGSRGWPQHAPFDRIIVTAGAPGMPEVFISQLADNGILVIPCGKRSGQVLEVYHRTGSTVNLSEYNNVSFVPLVGQHGWKR